MTDTRIAVLPGTRDLEDAFAVRYDVFVEGQGVSEERELDGRDEDATHVLAYDDGIPVGTARLRRLDEVTGKVERVAVLEERRGEGWGRALMETVHAAARDRGFDELTLHGQQRVEGFYHALGYETVSDVFEEAGMPHVEMELELGARP